MKIIQTILFLTLIIFTSQKILADMHYVSKTGANISPFTSWTNAATNIQAAVNVASSNDTILVNDGTYYPGNQITVTNDITIKSVNGAKKTIVDGSYSHSCFYINENDTIDGLTITNGYFSSHHYPNDNAGGVYCDGGGTVQNCTISGNSGNGVYCNRGSAVINCTISGNSASSGGGVYCYGGTVENCTISGNSSDWYGGGLSLSSGGTVRNCIIKGNSAYSGGGVTGQNDFGSIVQNCTISENSAVKKGGGLYCRYTKVLNCVIVGNSAEYGGGVYGYSSGTIQSCTISGNTAFFGGGYYCEEYNKIQNCIIYYNYAFVYPNCFIPDEAIFDYNCTTPLLTGNGNISAEPKLLDSKHIASDSPCIGVGNFNYTVGVDIDGDSWQNPPAIGCDQPNAGTCTGQLSISVYSKYDKVITGYTNYFYASIIGCASQNQWSFDNGDTWQNTLGGYYSWNNTGTYKVILTAFNDTYPAGVSATVVVEVVEKQTHYVDVNNSTPIPPYTSLETAAINIQDAVNAAVADETVLVNDGIYYLTNQILTTKDIIVKSINGAENTIVNGNHSHRCFYINSGVTLDGFTITNGYANRYNTNEYASGSGGGVYCVNGIVKNCIIIGNSASAYGGGGIYCYAGGMVQNCIISQNSTAGSGGGVYCVNGIVKNCIISGNSANYDSGGVFLYYNSIIKNCTISGNSAKYSGGGVRVSDSTVQNCTIIGNSAARRGGANIYNSIVQNCIIYYNYAFIYTNYYFSSKTTFNYNCTTPLPNGVGNISNEPILLDSGHITSTSPCVSTGNIDYAFGTDIDGDAWQNPPAIGCDQPNGGACTGQLSVSIFAKHNIIATGYTNYFWGSIIGHAAQNQWSFDNGDTRPNTLGGFSSWNIPGNYKVILTAFNDTYSAGISATVIVEVVEKKTHYADVNNSTPAPPYTSLETAAINIKDAVNAAAAGEIVLVNDGTYYPGNQISITKDIIVKSINGAENTIVNGNHSHGCFHLYSGNIIDGFTITNGYVGVMCEYGGTVQNCIISGNSSYGVLILYNGIIQNCIVSGNSGSGIQSYLDCTVKYCTIVGNSADDGGGIYNSGGIVQHCIISQNSANGNGGGVYLDHGTVLNCTISQNSANNYGGVYCRYGTILNSIIWNNANGNYCCSENYYNCIEYWPNLIYGIITNNPEFRDAASGDYHLESFSPCIDAGTNLSWMWTATDLDGNPRITDGIVDMGAYEYIPEPGFYLLFIIYQLLFINLRE